MKVVLNIICWILVVTCCYFPFAYHHSEMDKKEIQVSHILVNTQEEASNIKQQILDGASFEEMAEIHSLCPSKEDKGSIGYKLKGALLKEIEDVAFNTEVRKISEPVQSPHGWHLIKISDIKYYSDRENFKQLKI